jgi:opacity protein-like surface antigen
MRSKLFLLALSLAGASALAAQPGYYGGIQGGVNDVKDWGANVSLGAGVSLPGTVGANDGKHLGLFLGRQTENARFEIEYQWGDFDITSIKLGPLTQAMATGGDYKALTFNAYRTHDFDEKWTGYLGLGIGWGRVTLPRMGFTGGCNCFPEASKSGFAYQGRVGMEYHFDERNNAFLQYTSLRLPKPSSSSTPGVDYARKSVGVIAVGYRRQF